MKKSLFSLAFLAASGGYVVYANHSLSGAGPGAAELDQTGDTAAIAPQLQLSDTSALLDSAPQPSVTIAPRAVPRPVIAAPAPAPVIATSTALVVAPVAPQPAPVLRTLMIPPLPRPRPSHPTQTTVATRVATVAPPSVSHPTQATGAARVAAVAPPSGPQYHDGTYTGTSENAYYGRVQVQVTVTGKKVTSIKALDYPSDRRTSRFINSRALPVLRQEVMQVQSANVDAVSGATLTSGAYIKSLGNALRKATAGNA